MWTTTETMPAGQSTSIPSIPDFSNLVACAAKGSFDGLLMLERLVIQHPDLGERLVDHVRRRERRLITSGTTTKEFIEKFRRLFALGSDGPFEAFLVHHVTVSFLELIRHGNTAGAAVSSVLVRRYQRVLEKLTKGRNHWMNALIAFRSKTNSQSVGQMPS